jgi:hypothetical protein
MPKKSTPAIDPDLQPDPEALTPEQAFREADELFWGTKKLKPSKRRAQYAAQALGNRLLCGTANIQQVGNITDEESGEERPRYNLYEGLFIDAVCMVYLCICPESDVILAARKPEAVIDKALTWGEREGIDFGSPKFEEAQQIYWRIFEQMYASQFEMARTAGAPDSGNE